MQEFRWNLTGFSWRGMKGKNITEGLKERKTDTSQTQQRKGNASRKKLLGSNVDQEWWWSWWRGGRPGPWLRLICNCKSVISDESTCILKFQGWKCVIFFFLVLLIKTQKSSPVRIQSLQYRCFSKTEFVSLAWLAFAFNENAFLTDFSRN